jgi:hypothetical protein
MGKAVLMQFKGLASAFIAKNFRQLFWHHGFAAL